MFFAYFLFLFNVLFYLYLTLYYIVNQRQVTFNISTLCLDVIAIVFLEVL